ncbi:MAG: glutathione peroxidase [Granulosicoccus sp.]
MITSRRQFGLRAIASLLVLAGAASVSPSPVYADSGTTEPGNTLSVGSSTDNNACNDLLSHELRPLMGPTRRPLCDQYADQVLLIVNTASKCGFTPQFEDLEKLHKRYSKRGFQVLGFPSGDFRQELTSEAEVAEFCELNYGVTFPMFEKIPVSGVKAHPLYQELAKATGVYPQWNFNKYLVDRNGNVVSHYPSGAMPMSRQMINDIEALL